MNTHIKISLLISTLFLSSNALAFWGNNGFNPMDSFWGNNNNNNYSNSNNYRNQGNTGSYNNYRSNAYGMNDFFGNGNGDMDMDINMDMDMKFKMKMDGDLRGDTSYYGQNYGQGRMNTDHSYDNSNSWAVKSQHNNQNYNTYAPYYSQKFRQQPRRR